VLPDPSDSLPRYHHGDGASLRHSEHIQRATFFFHDITDTDPPPETSQRELFKILHSKDITPLNTLADKFCKREKIGDDAAKAKAKKIVEHTRELPKSLPSRLRYHAFELVYNAIPTRMRERWRANQPLVCPLCNSANETIHHLHTCSTSQLGASLIVQRHPDRNLLSTLLQIDEGDLDFTGNCPPDQRLVKLIFSLSVWRTRRYFLQPVFLPTTPRRAGRRIANYFLRLYQSILHKKRRKKRDKSAEKKKFLEELSKVPRQALIAFTDGSSLGNPGPSGAGFYLLTRRTPFSKHLFFSKHTPHSTKNNLTLALIIK
jgi:hypothetical protein